MQFGNPLDAMISQAGQGASRDPVRRLSDAPIPGTPTGRWFDVSTPVGSPGGRFNDAPVASPAYGGRLSDYSSASRDGGGGPTSYFSAASPITAGGISTGSSPFGALSPDFSRLSPDQLKHIQGVLSGLVYSAPLGGYITSAEANNPNSAFVKGYNGRPMTGGDAGANRQAQSIYAMIGDLPTRPIGTRALNALPGYNPAPRPSYNTQLGGVGKGPYGGPFSFPGYGT